VLVFEDDVQGMDDARDVTEKSQADVDKKVGPAAALEEDAERRQDDGEDDFEDVAWGESHVWRFFV